jgi:hypothetical protein
MKITIYLLTSLFLLSGTCNKNLVPNCSIYEYRKIEEKFIKNESEYEFLKYAKYMSDVCKCNVAYMDVYYCIIDKQKNKEIWRNNLLDELSKTDQDEALRYLIKAYYSADKNANYQINEYLLMDKYIYKLGDSILIKE